MKLDAIRLWVIIKTCSQNSKSPTPMDTKIGKKKRAEYLICELIRERCS